jgi:hypothetical protein
VVASLTSGAAQPAISLLFFLALKIYRWGGAGGYVKLGDWNKLHVTLDKLDQLVIHKEATLDRPLSSVTATPSFDENGGNTQYFSSFSAPGRPEGDSRTGVHAPTNGQEYNNIDRRHMRESIPLSEIGTVQDNVPLRGHSPVSPDTRANAPFYPPSTGAPSTSPPTAHFPPQTTHYEPQSSSAETYYTAPSTSRYGSTTSRYQSAETPASTYYTPQSYPPPGQQYPYQPYESYKPLDQTRYMPLPGGKPGPSGTSGGGSGTHTPTSHHGYYGPSSDGA